MREKVWLINPVVDILCICGGFLWLALMAFNAVPQFATSISFVSLLGTMFISTTHFGAPILAARASDSRVLRALGGNAGLVVVTLLAFFFAGLAPEEALGVVLQVFLVAVSVHFAMGNVAAIQMYLNRSGVSLSNLGSAALMMVFPASWLCAMTSDMMDQSIALHSFFGVALPQIPFRLTLEANIFLLVAATISGFIVCIEIIRLHAKLPIPMLIIIVNTLVLGASARAIPELWLLVPAFHHGLQTIALHGRLRISKSFLVGLGIMVAAPSMFHFVGLNEVRAYAALLALFGLHHFLTEAILDSRLFFKTHIAERTSTFSEHSGPQGQGVFV